MWHRALCYVVFVSILVLRLFSDHTQNLHYNGDYTAEKSLLVAAENYEKLGLKKTKGLPLPVALENGTEDFRPNLYTHYPPLPYWLFGSAYLLFGHSELAARILALVIALLGLYFALASVAKFQKICSTEGSSTDSTIKWYLAFIFLALNPGFLLFGDTIQQHPLTEMLQWASLLWCLCYLFEKASLKWGLLLYFLHVWTSFEWLVPLFFIFSFCIYKREENWRKALKPWLAFFIFGFLFPILLRLLHNAWGLGGFQEAIDDLIQRAKARSFGDPAILEMHYSLVKHLGKIFFGLLWFVGPVTFLLIVIHLKKLASAARRHRLPFLLLGLWGLGSLSWQFLMPQNAMAHAYSQMHIANFCFLTAAICIVLFWEVGKQILTLLTLLFCLGSGMFIQSEIFLPFISQSTRTLANSLCASDQKNLSDTVGSIRSSVVSLIEEKLAQTPAAQECNFQSRLASKILTLYAYGIKSRLEKP